MHCRIQVHLSYGPKLRSTFPCLALLPFKVFAAPQRGHDFPNSWLECPSPSVCNGIL